MKASLWTSSSPRPLGDTTLTLTLAGKNHITISLARKMPNGRPCRMRLVFDADEAQQFADSIEILLTAARGSARLRK